MMVDCDLAKVPLDQRIEGLNVTNRSGLALAFGLDVRVRVSHVHGVEDLDRDHDQE